MKKILPIVAFLMLSYTGVFCQKTIATVKLPNGKYAKIFDNNTWEYTTTPTKTSSANYFSSTPQKKKASATTKKRTSTYNSSATSMCGARTKSGSSCRRMVKGGGYCYQHR